MFLGGAVNDWAFFALGALLMGAWAVRDVRREDRRVRAAYAALLAEQGAAPDAAAAGPDGEVTQPKNASASA